MWYSCCWWSLSTPCSPWRFTEACPWPCPLRPPPSRIPASGGGPHRDCRGDIFVDREPVALDDLKKSLERRPPTTRKQACCCLPIASCPIRPCSACSIRCAVPGCIASACRPNPRRRRETVDLADLLRRGAPCSFIQTRCPLVDAGSHHSRQPRSHHLPCPTDAPGPCSRRCPRWRPARLHPSRPCKRCRRHSGRSHGRLPIQRPRPIRRPIPRHCPKK
jgi:hypothetical protein